METVKHMLLKKMKELEDQMDKISKDIHANEHLINNLAKQLTILNNQHDEIVQALIKLDKPEENNSDKSKHKNKKIK